MNLEPESTSGPLQRRCGIFLLVLFVVSRALGAAAGLRFAETNVEGMWQFLDPELLRTDLLRSLFYLHSQPPAFNAYLGLVLKLSGENAGLVLHALNFLFSLWLTFALFRLLQRLGLRPVPACALAGAYSVSPALLVYETLPFYPVVMALLTTLCANGAIRLCRETGPRAAIAFFAPLALICLTRSLYHLSFALVAAAITAPAWWPCRGRRVLAALTLALVGSVYVKNALLFSSFSSSTWMGLNLWNIVSQGSYGATDAERRAYLEARVAEGVLDVRVLSPSFCDWRTLPPPPPTGPRTSHPALDAALKSNGNQNYNHRAYLHASASLLAASREMIRREPASYFHAIIVGAAYYLRPVANHAFTKNRERLVGWRSVYQFPYQWRVDAEPLLRRLLGWSTQLAVYPVLLLGWLGALLASAWLWVRVFRRGGDGTSWTGPAVVFLLFLVAFNAAIGSSFELGENERLRFETDPITLALGAGAGCRLLRRRPSAHPRPQSQA